MRNEELTADPEAPTVPDEPIREPLASGRQDGARHQPWCAADVPPGADRCPRCQVWQTANRGALKTGFYSQQVLEHPAAIAAMAEKREALRQHVGEASLVQED